MSGYERNGLESLETNSSPGETDNENVSRVDKDTKEISDSAPFFQFKLCSLAFGKSPGERLRAIVARCCLEHGQRILDKSGADWQRSLKTPCNAPADYQHGRKEHVAIMVGANHCGYRVRSMRELQSDAAALEAFTKAFESAYGRDAEARVRSDYVLSEDGLIELGADGQTLPYFHLAVYAGLLSIIGAKTKPVIATIDAMRRRCLGYKTEQILLAEISKRTDGMALPERHRIKYVVTRHLFRRKIIKRSPLHGRATCYQIRGTQEEFGRAVDAMKQEYVATTDEGTRSESYKAAVETLSALGIRVGGWFGRKAAMPWSEKEIKALSAVERAGVSVDDLTALEAYYAHEFPKEEDFRRRDVITLLSNWGCELDRARRWYASQKKEESKHEKF